MIPLRGDNYALYIEGQRCNFLNVTWRYGVDMIPEITVKLPATDQVEDLPDRTAVTLIYRDDYWARTTAGVPRFCVLFEGELRSPGYSVSASGQRAIIYQGKHISECLTVQIKLTTPTDYIIDRMRQRTQTGIRVASLTGTTFDAFNPKNILASAQDDPELQKRLSKILDLLKKEPQEMNLYHYAFLALEKFKQILDNSLTASQYKAQAVSKYDLPSRIYIPSKDDLDDKFKWENLYNAIMYQYFQNNIAKVGDDLSFFQIIQGMLQLFIFEMNINPSPKSRDKMLQVKPSNHFIPVPTCNVIFPIMQPQFNFNENWESKITRLIQINLPPNGIEIRPEFEAYYRNIAPTELEEKFKALEKIKMDNSKLSDPEYKTLLAEKLKANYEITDLVTEEESVRGIISSENSLPSYLANVMNLVLFSGNEIKLLKEEGTDGKFYYLNSSGQKVEVEATNEEANANAVKINKFNNHLKNIESNGNSNGVPANAVAFLPNKIVLVANDNTAMKAASSYTVSTDGKITRNVNRDYMLFEQVKRNNELFIIESEMDFKTISNNGYIPELMKYQLNLQRKASEQFCFENERTYDIVSLNKPNGDSFSLNICGLTWKSIIIKFDPTSQVSVNTTALLVGLLRGLVVSEQYTQMIPPKAVYSISDLVYYQKDKATSGIGSQLQVDTVIENIRIISEKVIERVNKEKKIDRTIFKEVLNIKVTATTDSQQRRYASQSLNGSIKESEEENQKSGSDGGIFGTSVEEKKDNVEISYTSENISNALMDKTNPLGSGIVKKLGLNTDEKIIGFSETIANTGKAVGDAFNNIGIEVGTGLASAWLLQNVSNKNKLNPVSINNPLGSTAKAALELKKQGLEIKQNTLTTLRVEAPKIIKSINDKYKELEDLREAYDIKTKAELKAAEILKAARELLANGGDAIGKKAAQMKNGIEGLKDKAAKLALEALDSVQEKAKNIQNEVEGIVAKGLNVFVNEFNLSISSSAKEVVNMYNEITQSEKEVKVNFSSAKKDEVVRITEGEVGDSLFTPINTTDTKFSSAIIYEKYTNPLCQYFFYFNRYKPSSIGVPMIHNPYLTPGYPGIIVDNKNTGKSILMYVSAVTHSIEKGKATTYASCSLARRANDLVAKKFSSSSKEIVNFTDDSQQLVSNISSTKEDKKQYDRLYKQLQEFPFFGKSEFSSNIKEGTDKLVIDNSYQKLLGSNVKALRDSDLHIDNLNKYDDMENVYPFINRDFQMLVITGLTDKYKTTYENWLIGRGDNGGHRASIYVTEFSEMDNKIDVFPRTINIIKLNPDSPKDKIETEPQVNEVQKNESLSTRHKEFKFKQDIRGLISEHTRLTDSSEAIYVSIKDKEFN